MDKLPVGQLPDLASSNNDDEIMVITNSEYNQLKKEKISDLITDFTSTDENNAIVKGTDGKLFTKDFGNASNITEGTLPVSVLPDIPKDKLPEIETDDLPDSGITAGTYTYPTDIVINSKGQVTSITEGQAGANNANQDLSNLGPLGLDKINQSKALETGSVSSDADVYADVLKYAHSTFDLSKFTVVGSPNITDDGIASGFSTANYITTSSSFNFASAQSFEILLAITTPSNTASVTSYTGFFNTLSSDNTEFITVGYELENSHFVYGLGTTTGTFWDIYSSNTIQPDTKYYIKIKVDNTTVTVQISTNGTDWITDASGTISSPLNINNVLRFGLDRSLSRPFEGTIDLKSFSITADGVEVFSGNKTGLDVIKSDNYEVVGSPTITEDGVASGFSQDSYLALLNIGQSLSSAEDWSIKFPIIFGDDIQTRQEIFGGNKAAVPYSLIVRLWPTGKMIVVVNFTNTVGFSIESINTVAANTMYNVEVKVKNAVFYFYLNGILQGQHTVTENTFFTNALRIGASHLLNYPFLGSIDLNAFKIYVDGDLVYQPCLKIPYTQSKTGSKIVDAIYRERVIDLYEQEGYAPYYTIDEANKNFTLPMGEIYGMLEGKKQNAHAIGEPIIRLDNTLYSNEIRLEGALVSKTTYADLYKVYGDNYAIATEGITDETKFYLPDFRNRAVWGSSGFGYLGAGLPSITGTIKASNIWAGTAGASGCFSVADNGDNNAAGNGSSRGRTYTWTLNASSSSSIYGNSDTVQPPAIKVRVVTRFKDEDYPIVIESGNTNNSDGLDDILG